MKEVLFCYSNNVIVESIIWLLQSYNIEVRRISPSKLFDYALQHTVIIPASVMPQHSITRTQLDNLKEKYNISVILIEDEPLLTDDNPRSLVHSIAIKDITIVLPKLVLTPIE